MLKIKGYEVFLVDNVPFEGAGAILKLRFEIELFFKWKDFWPAAILPQQGTPLGDYIKARSPLAMSLAPLGDTPPPRPMPLQSDDAVLNGLPHASFDFTSQPRDLGAWTLEVTSGAVGQIAASLWNPVAVGGATQNHLKPEVIEDVVLVVHYSVT